MLGYVMSFADWPVSKAKERQVINYWDCYTSTRYPKPQGSQFGQGLKEKQTRSQYIWTHHMTEVSQPSVMEEQTGTCSPCSSLIFFLHGQHLLTKRRTYNKFKRNTYRSTDVDFENAGAKRWRLIKKVTYPLLFTRSKGLFRSITKGVRKTKIHEKKEISDTPMQS